MTRTTLTKTAAPGEADYSGLALTKTAADTSNQNQFAASGNDLIIAHNTGASTYTVTITSSADALGRTQDVDAVDIEADEILIFGPLKLTGWVQSDGYIYLESNNAAVEFGIIAL